MQSILNVALVAAASLVASFLLLVKLHRQLSHMIDGRIYQEHSQNCPVGVHAKYRASPKELTLHVTSFSLLGITVGLLVYLEQQILFSVFFGMLSLAAFYLLANEIRRNFNVEEEKNRGAFEREGRH